MLSVSNLSKSYSNDVKALDQVSLDIPKGMFGLLGPNGAGKSTLMRTIATLQEPDEGAISFDEIDVLKQKHEVRKLLGYLPQEFGTYPRISLQAMLDHLAVLKGIAAKGERSEMVEGLMNQVNLYDVRKKSIDTFSGGMKQRFGIAQALIGDPQLIIVDEPTAGLDPEERNRFSNLLAEISENIVVILSTHIVDDVSELCSRMAIMGEGRILLTGEPAALIAELEGRLWQLTIERADLGEYQQKHNVISNHLFAGRTRLHVLNDDSPGGEFEPLPPSLADVYFSILAQHRIEATE
jgi:ABC-2 type transport system ATP-binding protein